MVAHEIRRLTDLDPDEMGPLIEASTAEGYDFVKRRFDEWQSGQNRFEEPGEVFFGAYVDGRLVGTAGLTRISPSIGRVRCVYLLPELRGTGLGGALVRKVIDSAKGVFPELILHTRDAGAFYEHLGFTAQPMRESTHWMAVPNSTTVHDRPQALHPAIKNVWRWSAVISWGILAIILGAAEFSFMHFGMERHLWIPLVSPLFCFAMAALAWSVANRQYAAWTYQLRTHDLVMSHGVIWKSRRCIARGRVQHIDINSGPLDRRWGLVQVSVYVAGALGSVGSIPGLTPEEAEALRAAVLEGRASNA